MNEEETIIQNEKEKEDAIYPVFSYEMPEPMPDYQPKKPWGLKDLALYSSKRKRSRRRNR